MNANEKKERLTVDLNAEQKHKLRVVTALHGEKHMQKMVIRLIDSAYERMNVGSISQDGTTTGKLPHFGDEEIRNLQA